MSEIREINAKIIYQDINNNYIDHPTFRIIHFNDVYNIESGTVEPKAGAARFLTAVNYLKSDRSFKNIVLFSGDAFSPSESEIKYDNFIQLIICFSKFNNQRFSDGCLLEQFWY